MTAEKILHGVPESVFQQRRRRAAAALCCDAAANGRKSVKRN